MPCLLFHPSPLCIMVKEVLWSRVEEPFCRVLIATCSALEDLQGGKEGLSVSILVHPYSRITDMLLEEQSGAALCQHRMFDIQHVQYPSHSGSFCWHAVPFPGDPHTAHKWSLPPRQLWHLPSPASLGGGTFLVTCINQKCLGRFSSYAILLSVFTATVTNSWHLSPACVLIAAACCLFAHGALW